MTDNGTQSSNDQSASIETAVSEILEKARAEVRLHKSNVAKRDALVEQDQIDAQALAVAAQLLMEQHSASAKQRAKDVAKLNKQIGGFEKHYQIGTQPKQAPAQLTSAPAAPPASDPSGTAATPQPTEPTSTISPKLRKKLIKLQEELRLDEANGRYRHPTTVLGLAGFELGGSDDLRPEERRVSTKKLNKVRTDLGIPENTPLSYEVLQDAVTALIGTDSDVSKDKKDPKGVKPDGPFVLNVGGLVKKVYHAAKGSPTARNTGSQTRS